MDNYCTMQYTMIVYKSISISNKNMNSNQNSLAVAQQESPRVIALREGVAYAEAAVANAQRSLDAAQQALQDALNS